MITLTNPGNTCCFSGYRPEKLPWGAGEDDPRCLALKGNLALAAERLIASGIRNFICGMARGCDTYFCEAVLRVMEDRPGVTVEAAIPYERQASGWREEDRARYARLVEQCTFATYVARDYSRDCIHRRNRYMVDNSSVLVAVYDGQPGGTKNTVAYARKRGLEIIEIRP